MRTVSDLSMIQHLIMSKRDTTYSRVNVLLISPRALAENSIVREESLAHHTFLATSLSQYGPSSFQYSRFRPLVTPVTLRKHCLV